MNWTKRYGRINGDEFKRRGVTECFLREFMETIADGADLELKKLAIVKKWLSGERLSADEIITVGGYLKGHPEISTALDEKTESSVSGMVPASE